MNYTEKNKLLDKISAIALMAILVEVFLYAVDSAYTTIMNEWLLRIPMILNIIGVIFLAIAITLYIIAYKKGKTGKIVFATEFLVLAMICPFLNFWYYLPGKPLKDISPKVLWIIALVYYVIRVVYTCIKAHMQSADRKSKKKKK